MNRRSTFLSLALLMAVGTGVASWLAPVQRVEFVETGTLIHDGMDAIEFEVVNPHSHPLVYTGSADRPNLIYRWYEGEELQTRTEGCSCGRSHGRYELPPGGRLRIVVPHFSHAPTQVGILLHPENSKYPDQPALSWLPEAPRRWVIDRYFIWANWRWKRHVVWSPWMDESAAPSSELLAMEFLNAGVILDAANAEGEDPFAMPTNP